MPITKAQLAHFPNPVFVETGTYRGEAIRFAREIGFQQIYSVDIDAGRIRGLQTTFQREGVNIDRKSVV